MHAGTSTVCPQWPLQRGGGGQSQEREEKERGLEAGSHVSALPATPYSQNSGMAEDSKFKLAFQVLRKLSLFR